MKQSQKATCLLSSDWHIRGDRPVARIDDYREAQTKKIEFILSLAQKHSCPVLIAGDVGHKALWGDQLLNYFIDILNRFSDVRIIAIAGQHDLPNHRLDRWEEAGIGVLNKSLKEFEVAMDNCAHIPFEARIRPFHYSQKIEKHTEDDEGNKQVALMHHMVIKSQGEKLWHDQVAHSAKWYLRKFPCYDLIVTGDNHQSFSVEYEGRRLVNAGSLMRMSANQIDHRPSVYLWYAETNEVERVYLPHEENVIDRSHIDETNERDERIEAYVNRLKKTSEIGLSFEKNIENFFKSNRTRKSVMDKVWSAIE